MVCGKCNEIFTDVNSHNCGGEIIVRIDTNGSQSINPFKPKPIDRWSLAAGTINIAGIVDCHNPSFKFAGPK